MLYGELKEGRRSVGGQYKRFKDCLKATLKKNAVPLDQLEKLAENRKGWREICTTGILFMQETQDKTEDERRRRRHEHAARNREKTPLICVPPVAAYVYHA